MVNEYTYTCKLRQKTKQLLNQSHSNTIKHNMQSMMLMKQRKQFYQLNYSVQTFKHQGIEHVSTEIKRG